MNGYSQSLYIGLISTEWGTFKAVDSILAPFSLSPDPSLQTVALDDGDVSEDAPRVGLEEMMRIRDGGREEGGGGVGRGDSD